MKPFEIEELIKNIQEKTENGVIVWKPYDFNYDTNRFAHDYFNSIIDFIDSKGYVSEFENGFLYLIPSFSEECCLCLQPTFESIPTAINYEYHSVIHYASLQELYELVDAPSKELSEYIKKINA